MEFQHELIIPNEGLPFKIFLFEGSRGNYIREKHWHTSIEIFAVMEGELLFYINHEKYPLHAGELLIVNANEIHSVLLTSSHITKLFRSVQKNHLFILFTGFRICFFTNRIGFCVFQR